MAADQYPIVSRAHTFSRVQCQILHAPGAGHRYSGVFPCGVSDNFCGEDGNSALFFFTKSLTPDTPVRIRHVPGTSAKPLPFRCYRSGYNLRTGFSQ